VDAERWGDEVLQPVPRRIVWNLLKRNRKPIKSYLEGARVGVPVSVAASTAPPIAMAAAKFNNATDANVLADIGALPGLIDHVDELIAEGVIGGEDPNVADFQIALSVALLLTIDDLRPLLAGRPAEELARRIAPDFPGHAPPTLPAEWLAPITAATQTATS
jgi:glutathione S-transferase